MLPFEAFQLTTASRLLCFSLNFVTSIPVGAVMFRFDSKIKNYLLFKSIFKSLNFCNETCIETKHMLKLKWYFD